MDFNFIFAYLKEQLAGLWTDVQRGTVQFLLVLA
jgi:hypothetical protein